MQYNKTQKVHQVVSGIYLLTILISDWNDLSQGQLSFSKIMCRQRKWK